MIRPPWRPRAPAQPILGISLVFSGESKDAAHLPVGLQQFSPDLRMHTFRSLLTIAQQPAPPAVTYGRWQARNDASEPAPAEVENTVHEREHECEATPLAMTCAPSRKLTIDSCRLMAFRDDHVQAALSFNL